MRRHKLVLAFSVAALPLPSTAQAATFLITYTGTISGGYDETGVFGTARTDLTGQSYVAVYTLTSPTPGATVENDGTRGLIVGGSQTGSQSPLLGRLTIAGTTVQAGSSSGGALQLDGFPNGTGYDHVFHDVRDYSDDGILTTENLFHNNIASFVNNVVSSSDFTGSLDYRVQAGDLNFGYAEILSFTSGTDRRFGQNRVRYAYASLVPDSVAIVPMVAGAVPEPATWAVLIIGFGAVGGSMRMRRAKLVYA